MLDDYKILHWSSRLLLTWQSKAFWDKEAKAAYGPYYRLNWDFTDPDTCYVRVAGLELSVVY